MAIVTVPVALETVTEEEATIEVTPKLVRVTAPEAAEAFR